MPNNCCTSVVPEKLDASACATLSKLNSSASIIKAVCIPLNAFTPV